MADAVGTTSKTLAPVEGETPLHLVVRNGVRYWQSPDRLFPLIAGGDGEDPPTGDPPKPGEKPPEKPTGKEDEPYDKDRAMLTIKKLREDLKTAKAGSTELEELRAKVKAAEDAQLSETERLKKERDEAAAAAQTASERATSRLITAEAKVQATTLGIKPERINHALRLADLSAVKVGDDGEPDAEAIKTALEAVLTDLPELKDAKSGTNSTGSVPPTPSSQHASGGTGYEQWRRARLGPALAAAEGGKK